MKKVIQCVMIMLGTFIGAGFASGKEIVLFFASFGWQGWMGIVLSSALCAGVSFGVLRLCDENNALPIESFYMRHPFFSGMAKLFTFLCFCIMLAAMGAYVEAQYPVHGGIGAIMASVICFFTFLWQFHGLEKINHYLVPMIILGMLIVATASFRETLGKREEVLATSFYLHSWWQSAFLYAGYNTFLLFPILKELTRYHLTKREMRKVSVVFFILLCVLGGMLCYMLQWHGFAIFLEEIPTLTIAKQTHVVVFAYYRVVMILAILTTAVSCGYAFLQLQPTKYYFRNTIVLCMLGVVLAKVGFGNFISVTFPLFGYIGILQWIVLAWEQRRTLQRMRKDD